MLRLGKAKARLDRRYDGTAATPSPQAGTKL